jgi:hypothetical protein
MIIKTNAPANPSSAARTPEEFRREVSALLDRTEAESADLKSLLQTVTTEDESACEVFKGFALRLGRACESLELNVLESSALDLVALIENRQRNPVPAAKFRFLLSTSLELIAIEIRRIRSQSAN